MTTTNLTDCIGATIVLGTLIYACWKWRAKSLWLVASVAVTTTVNLLHAFDWQPDFVLTWGHWGNVVSRIALLVFLVCLPRHGPVDSKTAPPGRPLVP